MEAREKGGKPGGCSSGQQISKGWHERKPVDFKAESVIAPMKTGTGISSYCAHLFRLGHWPLWQCCFHLLPMALLGTSILQTGTHRRKMPCALFHLLISGRNRIGTWESPLRSKLSPLHHTASYSRRRSLPSTRMGLKHKTPALVTTLSSERCLRKRMADPIDEGIALLGTKLVYPNSCTCTKGWFCKPGDVWLGG